MMIDDVAKNTAPPSCAPRSGRPTSLRGFCPADAASAARATGALFIRAISTVRDGLTGMALVLELLAKSKKPIMGGMCAGGGHILLLRKKYPVKTKPLGVIRGLTDVFKNKKVDLPRRP